MWFFIVCGLIAYTGTPVSASCQLELNPPKVLVRFGDSFSANCTSLSKEGDGMGWESTHGGVERQPGATHVTLKIGKVDVWSLEPLCFVDYLDGVQCTEPLPVTVYKKPESVSLAQPPVMIEGEQYRMQCVVVDVAPAKSLVVNWYKGDKIIHKDTFDVDNPSLVTKSSDLNLVAHRDDNGAQIRCEAKLDLWQEPNPSVTQSQSHRMTVLYPPAFAMPANETLELQGRKNISLNCTATGNPPPVYKWQIPHGLEEAQNGNQAIIVPSFPVPGTYSCATHNEHGSSVKYFIVVEGPRNLTTFAAILGGFLVVAVLLLILGIYAVTPDGTFSFNKGNYIRGQPTSSGPV